MKRHKLPNIYQITPDPLDAPSVENFLADLDATLQSGVQLVQFRAKKMSQTEQLHIARQALGLCRNHGASLVFNGAVEMAFELGCDGVHLSSQTLMSHKQRPIPGNMLLSAACHDAKQILQAQGIGVDFITLSPVLSTTTHPEAQAMGWERFRELVAESKIPVYALGGMRPEMIAMVNDYGAHGIAAISATWRIGSSFE